ncbi:MAG: cupin domain-containing protein [Candidatus Cloacimonetes bacterium]|jgi:mannose-6-phosphate isomerase-like protein (cupin superfamily)|nr:cupin domain-containing protein [Candidatus Cloacimonadota bacterium]
MFIKKLSDCPTITAGDNTALKVIIHPDHDPLDISYSFAHAIVKPGETSYEHLLTTSETYYILQGSGVMHINDEHSDVNAEDCIFIPSMSRQSISNTGNHDLVFLCIVEPAWKVENEKVFYNKS